MKLCNWLAAMLLALGMTSQAAVAQQYNSPPVGSFPGAGGEDVIQRLMAAEARIRQLEQQQQPQGVGQPYLTSTGSLAADEDLAKRLASIEKTVGGQKDALSDLKKALGGKASSGTSASTMKISGRVHFDYWGFPESDPGIDIMDDPDFPNLPPQARIGFRRLRFGVAGDVKDNMTYKIEMEFAAGADSQFRDAYLGFKELAYFQTVLIGNQKRPYGLDHLNSSRYNVFIERPFVVEAFNQDARRFGICSYGVSDDERYNWRFGVFNLENVQDSGSYVNNALQLEVAGRFASTVWYDEASDGRGYAHLAISGTFADPDGNSVPRDSGLSGNQGRFRTRPEARTGSNRWLDTGAIAGADTYGLMGLEAVLNVGALQLVGEFQNVWMSRTNDSDLYFHGAYGYVSYFLTGEHIPWERDSGTLGRVKPFENFFLVDRCCGGVSSGLGAWEIAARLSYADFNDDNIFGGRGNAVTFGLNWYWNPNARMQFNYIAGNIDDRRVSGFPGLQDGNYTIFGTRFMIDF
jgi:phosphate-selective porin OprO/OprP